MPKILSKDALLQVRRDKKLVKKLLAGDERAFKSFVDEYIPKLYRHARCRLKIDEDVEDIVQIVFSNAAKNLSQFRGEATLLSWLKSICTNEINRHLGAHAKRVSLEISFHGGDALKEIVEAIEADANDEPEAVARREDLLNVIKLAMDHLPESYAHALELKYIDGLSSKEIAAIFGISDEALQSLLARARKAFQLACSDEIQEILTDAGQSQSSNYSERNKQ